MWARGERQKGVSALLSLAIQIVQREPRPGLGLPRRAAPLCITAEHSAFWPGSYKDNAELKR